MMSTVTRSAPGARPPNPNLNFLYTEFKNLTKRHEQCAAAEAQARARLEELQDRKWAGGSVTAEQMITAGNEWNEATASLTRIRRAIGANHKARRQEITGSK